MQMLRWGTIGVGITLALGCAASDGGRDSAGASASIGASATSPATGGGDGSGADSGGTDSDGGPGTATGILLDVGAAETGASCQAGDPCCIPDVLPDHEVLDAFLAAYPAANMPKTTPEVQAFIPQADGHMMAWSDENVGGELVDLTNGGVIDANLVAGRALARAAAEAALPAGSMIVDVREDPAQIENLGGVNACVGVGWAWGSLLFEAADESVGELVYLYVGLCLHAANGDTSDVEVFFYSDQAIEVCPAPA